MQKHIYYVSSDWMNVHHFDEDTKVQRFCLTLLGEGKIVVSFFRTLRRHDMGTSTEFIQTKVLKIR